VGEVAEKKEERKGDFCSRTRLYSEKSADFQGHHRNRGFGRFQANGDCGQSLLFCDDRCRHLCCCPISLQHPNFR